MKTCSRCRAPKERAEFRANRCQPDGLNHYCKPCQTAAGREYRRRYPEKGRAAVARYRERYGRRPEDRIKRTARERVRKAVRAGKLVKPSACPDCGTEGVMIHAHHADYARPLDVRWACASCHGYIHAGGVE